MYNPLTLFKAPAVNPINRKAESIPGLNPINMYGRVWFFSWFGFMIAFWSWYAFPPLLTVTIAKDLKLSHNEVLNSNIIGLVATLIVRCIAGPFCDLFGPRKTFAGCLLLGAIPTFLAGTAHNAGSLYAIRFFVGILGGSFVPCQVWSTGFFDKSIVGTSNAFTAGFGNSGGGITYFLMPEIFDSLVRHQHLSAHVAWRVAFVVPGICIVAVALALFFLCDDTPTGSWANRHMAAEQNLANHGIEATVVDAPTGLMAPIGDEEKKIHDSSSGTSTPPLHGDEKMITPGKANPEKFAEHEAHFSEQAMLETARGEIVAKPTFREIVKVIITPQTLVCGAAYFCSFGAELSINGILGAYYLKQFPKLGQTGTGRWAAMFGLLNIVFRPIGGLLSDFLYRKTKSVWSKRILVVVLQVITGVFLIVIGKLNSHDRSTLFGLIAGMALFLEAGNGAVFSYVPHVIPQANGVVSGFTGAFGNLGGIIFSIVFRYNGVHYGKSIWIIGVITIVLNLLLSWIKPVPTGQIGGH